MPTMTYPVRIERVLDLGSHCIEFLEDGSVDIVDADIERAAEYTHLSGEEAYLLFTALYEKFKMS